MLQCKNLTQGHRHVKFPPQGPGTGIQVCAENPFFHMFYWLFWECVTGECISHKTHTLSFAACYLLIHKLSWQNGCLSLSAGVATMSGQPGRPWSFGKASWRRLVASLAPASSPISCSSSGSLCSTFSRSSSILALSPSRCLFTTPHPTYPRMWASGDWRYWLEL